jgi:hypothetical protein
MDRNNQYGMMTDLEMWTKDGGGGFGSIEDVSCMLFRFIVHIEDAACMSSVTIKETWGSWGSWGSVNKCIQLHGLSVGRSAKAHASTRSSVRRARFPAPCHQPIPKQSKCEPFAERFRHYD